jgi:hypothetical protein
MDASTGEPEPVQWDLSRTALNQILATMRDCFISEWAGILTVKVAHPDLVTGIDAIVPTGWWVSRVRGGVAAISPERPEVA